MTDAILSILALAGFAAFLFILGYWVAEPALITFLVLGFVLAAYDFWRAFKKSGPNGG